MLVALPKKGLWLEVFGIVSSQQNKYNSGGSWRRDPSSDVVFCFRTLYIHENRLVDLDSDAFFGLNNFQKLYAGNNLFAGKYPAAYLMLC